MNCPLCTEILINNLIGGHQYLSCFVCKNKNVEMHYNNISDTYYISFDGGETYYYVHHIDKTISYNLDSNLIQPPNFVNIVDKFLENNVIRDFFLF